MGIDYSLPYGGITCASDLQYNFITAAPSAISSLVWNMRIQKNITRNGSLSARLLVHDILNQNRGFSAVTSQNLYREEQYNTIGRYWLMGVVWHFTRR